MEAIQKIVSRVVPLPLKDIDTDLIIPAQYLTSISREGYGENLFRRLRDNDPQFPLNQERFRGARILAADSNFGCGSSREHAVWALQSAGFAVIIAKSFADIFFNNSAKNGLLLLAPAVDVVDRILSEAGKGNLELVVDLPSQTLRFPDGESFSFPYDPFRKHCLLHGLDDIDYILAQQKSIDAFRQRQAPTQFFLTTEPNH